MKLIDKVLLPVLLSGGLLFNPHYSLAESININLEDSGDFSIKSSLENIDFSVSAEFIQNVISPTEIYEVSRRKFEASLVYVPPSELRGNLDFLFYKEHSFYSKGHWKYESDGNNFGSIFRDVYLEFGFVFSF